VLVEHAADFGGVDGLPPLDFELVNLETVGGPDLAPALAELAAVDGEDFLAGAVAVPEAARMRTSCDVWKSSLSPASASAKILLNCGVR
jgi:hypothetical protein